MGGMQNELKDTKRAAKPDEVLLVCFPAPLSTRMQT